MVNMHGKKVYLLAVGLSLGLWTQWAVSRLPKQRLDTSSLCLQCSVFTIDSQITTTKIWPSHFQPSGQPDVKTTEAFILQLKREYLQ